MASLSSSLLLTVTFCLFSIPLVSSLSLSQRKEIKRGVICFCNQAECVADGYLCKSAGLGCFSDLYDGQDFSAGHHGCIDLLPRGRERSCGNLPGGGGGELSRSQTEPGGSLLLCCQQDMCNHVDSPETRSKFNETIRALGSSNVGGLNRLEVSSEQRLELAEQDAAWFKAATVAVPICGALILLVLIILALRLLRSDPAPPLQPKLRVGSSSRHHGEMSPSNPGMDTRSQQGGVKKLPLLLYHQNDTTTGAPHGGCGLTGLRSPQEKNEANAKLNSPSCNLLDLAKSSQRAPCNLYQPLIPTHPPSSTHNDDNLYNKAFLIDWGSTIPHS